MDEYTHIIAGLAGITPEQLGAILAVLAIGYLLLSVFVAMTPTKADDEALTRLRAALEKASFLQPRDGEGVLSLPGRPARRVRK